MPDAISREYRRADRRGLLHAKANGHQRHDLLAWNEAEHARDGIELGPGFDAHHLIAQRARIDMHRYLASVFGEGRHQHLDAIVEHVGFAVQHALVVVLPHDRLQRVGLSGQHPVQRQQGEDQQQFTNAHIDSPAQSAVFYCLAASFSI